MDSKELRLFREAYGSIYEGYGKKKEGECVDKEDKGKHNCAKKVCHESFGEGTCIFGEHAVPDKNGFVSHYDVMFEHGIERNVPVADMEVLEENDHPTSEGHEGMYDGEQIAESEMHQQGQARTYREREILRQRQADMRKERDQRGMRPGPDKKPLPGRDKSRTQLNSVDLFDIVKGHLMSEGYADTEEAALAIMANMSEEWRNEIVEQNVITRTGTSTNAAGEKIKWTHNYDRSTGRSTVTDKFGTRDSTPVKRAPGPRLTRDGETRYIR